MVLGAVITVDAGAVVGLDQLQPVLVEIGERQIIPVDVIENSELQGHFVSARSCFVSDGLYPVVRRRRQLRPRNISRARTMRITSTGPSVIMKLRASRHILAIGISLASPMPPWICMQRSATRKPSSVPAILAM